MCSVPQLILKHLISSVVSLAHLVSSSVALPAELVLYKKQPDISPCDSDILVCFVSKTAAVFRTAQFLLCILYYTGDTESIM